MTTGSDTKPQAGSKRRQIIDRLFDFSKGRGLEIGPLDRPLLTRNQADVRYVDLYDRDRLATAHGATRDASQIPEIDHPLWDGTRMRTIGEAAKEGAPFDWVYASHVIEHVPDLIGWLTDVATVVANHGALVLVIPDRRYCFDVHRPPSTVGQILQAAADGDVIPSVRAVYDHHRSAVQAPPRRLWKGRVPTYADRIHDLDLARQQLARVRSGEYLDCHVWTFTDLGFAEVIDELRALGEIDWSIEALEPASRNGIEFYAVLRRGQEIDSGTAGRLDRPDWLDQPARLSRQVARLQRRNTELEQELAEIKASRRWRLASALTSPISALRGQGRS